MNIRKLMGYAVAFGCSYLAFSGAVLAFEPSGLLEIHQINVQQGASTLVIGPTGTTVLLDAGDDGKGEQIVAYLQLIGLDPEDDFDYTIAGHMDADHIGGFDEVFDAGYDVRFGNWYNGSTKTGQAITDYMAAVARTAAGGPMKAIVGDTIDLGGGAILTVVAVDGVVIGHGIADGAEKENDLSIAVLIQHGDFDYIWASDLGGGGDDSACTGRSTDQANVETPLAQAITPGGSWPLVSTAGVDVMHVNHHGSESSTNSDYMNLLKPEVAVIAVGAGQIANWDHPRKDVVESVLQAEAPCVTTPVAFVLQTEEGSPVGDETSLVGFAVGDIKITSDGVTEFSVEANGMVSQGPDERVAAGLPRDFPLGEVPEMQGLLLSEVVYDVSGSDDGLEWVELFNNGSDPVELSGFSLGNGGDDYTYSIAQLSGTIPACSTFVVGGPGSSAENAFPSIDYAVDFDPDFQNSGTVGDGVALFNLPASEVTGSMVPIDAVVYGPNNDNNLIDETGTPPLPDVGDADDESSIERSDLSGSWLIQSSPTPNSTSLPCETNPCIAGDTTLCLPGDDRFEVSVYFETAQGGGRMGDAQAVPLDSLGIDKGGLFYFIDSGNPEFLVKVLDGCGVNGHFWVFYAATTNIGFELTVRDTSTNLTRTYTNPDINPALTITDTEAFATCP